MRKSPAFPDHRYSCAYQGLSVPARGHQNRHPHARDDQQLTKELYPANAAHFETTPSKVERAIRHSIEVAWSRGKIENLNTIFGYNIYGKNDKPTNGEFIALIADRLMLEQIA